MLSTDAASGDIADKLNAPVLCYTIYQKDNVSSISTYVNNDINFNWFLIFFSYIANFGTLLYNKIIINFNS